MELNKLKNKIALGVLYIYCWDALIVRRTDEWSEFSTRIFSGMQYKLLGTLAMKISRISGFLRGEVGH